MIPLTINRRKVDFPTSYEDLTWGQAKALIAAEGDIEVISILTGLSKPFWETYRNVPEYLGLLAQAMEWVSKGPPKSPDMEKYRYFYMNGKKVAFPVDIGRMSVGAFEDAKGFAADLLRIDEELLKLSDIQRTYEGVTKIYVQCLTENVYDYDRAANLDIDGMAWGQVTAFAGFFLQIALESLNGTVKNVPKPIGRVRKFWRDIKIYLRNMDFYSRSDQ